MINPLSDSVGSVNQFLSALQPALGEERNFALDCMRLRRTTIHENRVQWNNPLACGCSVPIFSERGALRKSRFGPRHFREVEVTSSAANGRRIIRPLTRFPMTICLLRSAGYVQDRVRLFEI